MERKRQLKKNHWHKRSRWDECYEEESNGQGPAAVFKWVGRKGVFEGVPPEQRTERSRGAQHVAIWEKGVSGRRNSTSSKVEWDWRVPGTARQPCGWSEVRRECEAGGQEVRSCEALQSTGRSLDFILRWENMMGPCHNHGKQQNKQK